MKTEALTIRNTIIEEMARQGITIYALSGQSGVAYRTLHDYIRGKTEIGSDKLDKLLKSLNLIIKPP